MIWNRNAGKSVLIRMTRVCLRDINKSSNSELYKILDRNIVGEIQSSDRLKEFYKQLIQTDAQIRKLRKANELSITNVDNLIEKYKTFPDRAKRSLKIFNKSMNIFERPMKILHFRNNKKEKEIKKHDNVRNKNKVAATAQDSKIMKKTRNKRFDNSSEPVSFIIENKNIIIEYKPNRKSKCSHAPKDSKSHENQLKHPFYKNSQRLDELLDRFLDKNLPNIMASQFGFDPIFGNQKIKCKHPKVNDMTVINEKKIPDMLSIKNDVTERNEPKNYQETGSKKVDALINTLDVLTSTEQSARIINDTSVTHDLQTIVPMKHDSNNNLLLERAPNARKLLQTDADDDIREVMVANEANDDEKVDRNRRTNALDILDLKDKFKSPASILNPNWKGPMPLYPDELNTIVKPVVDRVETPVPSNYNSENDVDSTDGIITSDKSQDPSEINENLADRFESPVESKDSAPEIDELETGLSDMEYIEDYFQNKYDRLVQLAQAYSDYGVLESRKVTEEQKVTDKAKLEKLDRRMKLSIDGLKNRFKSNIFRRPKKGNEEPSNTNLPYLSNQFTNQSEGFRLKLLPISEAYNDNPVLINKTLQKHIKVSNFNTNTPEVTTSDNFDVWNTVRTETLKTTELFTKNNENGLLFSIDKSRRSLKSIELSEDNENEESLEIDTNGSQNDATINEELNIRKVIDNKLEASNNLLLSKVNNATESDEKRATDKLAKKFKNKLNTSESDSITKLNKEKCSNTSISLSDFFMFIINWFNTPNVNTSSKCKALIKQSNETEVNSSNNLNITENVGHRSRILLSIGDNGTVKVKNKAEKGVTNLNIKTGSINTNISNIQTPKTSKLEKVKSKIKRNADDSNLIFWNDLYDDEYGVSADRFENNIKDKLSIRNNLMKMPNVKKIANSLHRRTDGLRKERKNNENFKSEKLSRKKQYIREDAQTKSKTEKPSAYTRISRNAEGAEAAKKTDFAALTANMKKICRKAAADVASVNKVDEIEVNKEGQVASTLMQQLVRLMGNLVDYQVQQRTCRKLPPELQSFLEWLTSSSEPGDKNNGYQSEKYPESDVGKTTDQSESEYTLDMGTTNDKYEDPYSKSGFLNTLQAVDALLRQFEYLDNNEKSKLTGVKEYLESQMEYLQTQVTSDSDFNNVYTTVRFRRDVTTEKISKNEKHKKFRQRLKQAMRKLMRKFSKTHDSKTHDTMNGVEMLNIDDNLIKGLKHGAREKGSATVKDDKNLKGVHYKGHADVKKVTTVKD